MKKLIFFLLLLINTGLLFSQITDDPILLSNSKSETVRFLNRLDTFIKKEYVLIGKQNGIEFTNVYLTDVITGENISSLNIGTPSANSLLDRTINHKGIIDKDDVFRCIENLKFINNTIIKTNPDVYTEYSFTSKNYIRILAYYTTGKFAKWSIVIQPESYDINSSKQINIKDLDKIIDIFEKSYSKL